LKSVKEANFLSARRLWEVARNKLPRVAFKRESEPQEPIYGQSALSRLKKADLLVRSACFRCESFQRQPTSFAHNSDTVFHAAKRLVGQGGSSLPVTTLPVTRESTTLRVAYSPARSTAVFEYSGFVQSWSVCWTSSSCLVSMAMPSVRIFGSSATQRSPIAWIPYRKCF